MTTITMTANTTGTFHEFSMDLISTPSMHKIFSFELFKVKAQDREDVKQECVIRIMKALKTEKVDGSKLTSFFQTLIKRTVVDYHRHANRKIDQYSDTVFFCDGFGDGEGFDAADETFTAVETDETGYGVADIKVDFELNRHKFTPTEQKVIEYMLYNSEGMAMNLVEIAAELHINKSHSTRAFKKLKEIYGA